MHLSRNMDLNRVIKENIDNVDINAPATMHMLLVRLEEIFQENEEYMELLLERLDDMVITWEQPWYQKTYSLTRLDKENEDANSKSEIYRTDSFSKEESKIVHKNWKRFRKEFRLPDKPICIARWRTKNGKHAKVPHERVRHFVISYLAQGLERNLYQVYRHFITEYGSPVKGPYTAQEEKIMEICFHHCPKTAVVYSSALLSREPRNIYDKLHYMVNRKPKLKEKIQWKLQLATKFLQKLMEHSRYSLKELKNKKIDLSVWYTLREDMSQRYYKLQIWYRRLHVLLFVEYDVQFIRLGKKIMIILQSTPIYEVWTDIRRKDIPKKIHEHLTPAFLRGVVYRLIRRYQILNKKWLRDPIIGVVNHTLYEFKNMPWKLRRIKSLMLSTEGMSDELNYNVRMRF